MRSVVLIGGIWLLAAFGAVAASASRAASPAELGGLPRRPFVGVQVAPLADSSRAVRKLPATGGVEVAGLLPDGGAEAAKLRAGDVIVSLGGTEVAGPAAFVQAAAGHKAGEMVPVVYYRDGRKRSVDLVLKAMPLESDPRWETIYGSVESKGGRLRTVMTVPPGTGRHPAFMVIQGIGTFSVEFPPPALPSTRPSSRTSPPATG